MKPVMHIGNNPLFSRKQLIQLLWPLIVEQFLSVLIGMVDVLMVASVGETTVSGVSLVDSINHLVIQVLFAMTAGGTVVCAQFIGGKDKKNAAKKGSNEYFILSGGAAYGNAMHQRRTQGILDTLASAYNVTFEKSTEELSMTEEPVHIQEGDLKICICPGYISRDQFFEQIKGEYESDQYDTVLSVLGISRMADMVKGTRLGVIDCYSETNLQMFASEDLQYLVGKYSSIIGPSFAVMYNAITGHAEEFRPRGKSFHITQGFWSSDSREDFEEKYTLASSVEINAYNYEDLQKVIREFNPDASYDDLKALAEADTFKNALERRAR